MSNLNDMPEASSARHSAVDALADTTFIADIRMQMLKFATLQLNDTHLAEDAVQEALIGAMKNASEFSGKSAIKTWVFAILKNKIADILRKRQRMVEVSRILNEQEEAESFSMLFDQKGYWNQSDRPLAWGDPEASFNQKQFWIIFETCLANVPPNQARVFMMREIVGLNTDEICTEVGLSLSNLHVSLHRARMRLRECLENRWFDGEVEHA